MKILRCETHAGNVVLTVSFMHIYSLIKEYNKIYLYSYQNNNCTSNITQELRYYYNIFSMHTDYLDV